MKGDKAGCCHLAHSEENHAPQDYKKTGCTSVLAEQMSKVSSTKALWRKSLSKLAWIWGSKRNCSLRVFMTGMCFTKPGAWALPSSLGRKIIRLIWVLEGEGLFLFPAGPQGHRLKSGRWQKMTRICHSINRGCLASFVHEI